MSRVTIKLGEIPCPACGETGAVRKSWRFQERGSTKRSIGLELADAHLRCQPQLGGCDHRLTGREVAAEIARQNPDVSLEDAARLAERGAA